MLINLLAFAITLSIDSFGVGLTYGIRNIKIGIKPKLVLFCISFFITLISVSIGIFIFNFMPNWLPQILGSILLVFMGLWIIFANILKDPSLSDADNSQTIDSKEAISLGLAMSADSLICGVSFSMISGFSLIFPILTAVFQLLFLSVGIILGKKIKSIKFFSPTIWNRISVILLILFGISKLLLW